MIRPASVDDAAAAVGAVMAALGHKMEPDRITTVATILAASGWTPAELREAAQVLAIDPALRDSLRYGGTITPADFEGTRRGTETKDEDRVLVTLTGYALRVRSARLFSYAEAMALWNAAGCPGTFGDAVGRQWEGSMFEPVAVEGEDRPRWRLKH